MHVEERRPQQAPPAPRSRPVPAGEEGFRAAFSAGPHRRIDVGHAEVASWSFGEGPDLVFVHGWPLWSATFRRIAPALARGRRLHFFDLPGAGHTRTPDLRRVTLRDHVVATRRVIDALGLERYALLGHDSGGAIARMVAASDPRVSALVLGNTELPAHVPWQVKMYVALARLGLGGALLRGLRVGVIRRSALGFGGCFADPRHVEGEFSELFVDPLFTRDGGLGALALAENLDPTDLGDLATVHAAIRCPTLCIWGTEDPFFPLAGARAMLAGFGGGAELVELPGARLLAHEDRAEEFADHAARFLSVRPVGGN